MNITNAARSAHYFYNSSSGLLFTDNIYVFHLLMWFTLQISVLFNVDRSVDNTNTVIDGLLIRCVGFMRDRCKLKPWDMNGVYSDNSLYSDRG